MEGERAASKVPSSTREGLGKRMGVEMVYEMEEEGKTKDLSPP